MKLKQRLVAIILIVALCLNLIPIISQVAPAQAADSWTKNTANNPVFTENQTALTAGAISVIYDSNEHIYKMWYTHATSNLTEFDGLIDNILALDIANLINDIKNLDFRAIADNDSTNVTAVIDYLASLTPANLTTLLTGTGSNIGYATSFDGITWDFQSNVLAPTNSTWDQYGVSNPSVVHHSDNDTYEMWYTGNSVDVTALSVLLDDLAEWSSENVSTLLGDLVDLDTADFITHAINAPTNLLNLVVHLIDALNGIGVSIGHATSTDGINWTKDTANNPVLQKGTTGTWDRYGVAAPSVLYDSASSNYKMWYTGWKLDYPSLFVGLLAAGDLDDVVSTLLTGINMAIGYATSTDGITWAKDTANNPVLSKGSATVWDGYGVATPWVIRNSATSYEMWYTGIKMVPDTLKNLIAAPGSLEANLLSGTDFAIGHATSTDGISWTKDTSNPVLSKGTSSAWDGYGISNPSVIKIGNTSQMWYSGGKLNLSSLLTDILNNTDLSPALANTRILTGHAYTALRTLQSIAVTPTTASVAAGDTQQFTATGHYSDGSTENLTSATGLTWSSSYPAAATIAANSGTATGITLGTAIITASHSGLTSNEATLNVVSSALASIAVTPASPSVALGLTQQFSAIGTYSDSSTANITAIVTWSSSNTSVATIAAGGLATSKAVGTTTITATSGSISGNTILTVTAAAFTQMVITPDNPTISANSTIQFSATEHYTDGSTIDRTTSATWDSSNTGNATISTTGLATGVASGTTTISASYSGRSDTTTLTVTSPALSSVAITPTSPSVAAGKTIQLSLTGTYSDGNTTNLTTDSATIWASLNLATANVSSTGLVTGLAVGSVTLRATHLGLRDTVSVNVTAATLQSIAVTPATPKIVVSDTLQFTATGTYSDASTATITDNVTWSSSNTAVALISATSGNATGIAAGTANITATWDSVSGNTTLTVTTETLSSIAVTPASPSVAAGLTRQFNAEGTYSDDSTANLTALVTWSSSNTSQATIASGGLATSTTTGTTRITATLSGISGNTTLTITAATLSSIAVTPAYPSKAKGLPQQFTATGTKSDSSTEDITTSVTWTSFNTGVATINATSGNATTLAVGTTTITATSGSVNGNTTFTVTAAELLSISVTPSGPSVAAGRTQQFTATGTKSDSSTEDITTSVTWTSSDTAIASVSAAGLATSYNSGSATVTATKSSISGSTTLTVTAAVVDSITVSPVSPTIVHSANQTFRAVATYSEGSKVDITTTANWSSNDNTVATVGLNTGLATSVAAGGANITATWGSVSGNTTLTVTTATLFSIAVTPVSPSVAAGLTRQFTATGNFSGVFTANLTSATGLTWSSSDNNTARVNGAGLATSFAAGTATITATLGSVSGSASLTVTAAVLDSLSVTPVSPTVIFVSDNPPTLQFTATGVSSDGSTADNTTTASWTSLSGGVATIDSGTGLVTTVAAGSTVIKATLGGKSDNTTLIVLPDSVAPVITVTNPTDGLILANKNLTVSGSVDDTSAITTVIINGGTPITMTLAGGNFSQGVLLNSGSNTILVRAVDGSGNTGVSGTLTVEVDPNKPGVTISSPAEGTLTNTASATVTGTISGNVTSATTTLIFNGSSQSITVSSNETAANFTASVTLAEGVNIIVVRAYDAENPGDSDYLGTSGARRVTLDTTAPVLTITSPVSGSVMNTPGITVSGTVDDPGVTTAVLTLNGVPRSIPVVGGTFSQAIALAPGSNTISVVASDRAGNTSSTASPTTVTLDTSRPRVSVTSPANNLLTNVAGQSVSGNLSDPAITTATLYVNGSGQTISVAPDGTFSKRVSLSTGTNTIEVQAIDAAGNTGTSGNITVTVDLTAPTITIGLSDPTDAMTITVLSDAALSATPTVAINPSINMTQVDVNKWTGIYGSASSPIASGNYTVTANGTDIAGNIASKTATFTKETITVSGIAPTTVSTATTTLQVETNGAVNNASISVTQHWDNPSGNVNNPGANATAAAGVFVEIVASPELRDNLNQIYIQVDYNEDDLPAGTDESTLRLYLWDLGTGTWQIVPGSGVNTTANYIYGTATHLSKYGGFGTTVAPTPPAPTPTPPPSVGVGDTTAPRFSSLSVRNITKTSATIEWRTNEPSTTQVEYWSSPVKFTPLDKTLRSVHEVHLTDLEPATTYHYRIRSKDSAGNLGISEENTFTTLGVPATFSISNLTISPEEAGIGESITISVNVANSGDASGTYEVILKINGIVIATSEITLAGGASEKVTFSTSGDTDGTYTVDVNGLTGIFTVKAPPPPPPPPPARPAAFTISDLTISPAEADIGESITISVNVANTGELSGSYEVTLRINNVVVTSKAVTVTGGSSQKVTFTTARDAAGTYTVTIDGLSGAFTVRAAAPPPPPPPTPINWWLIGGIIAGVIIISLIIWIVIQRRSFA